MDATIVLTFVFALLGVAVALVINSLWIRLGMSRPARNSPQTNAPACGKCGYPARGISGLNCPECGADLREVGIFHPGMKRGGRVGLTIVTAIGYSMFFMFGAGVLFGVIQSQLPDYVQSSAHAGLNPASNQFSANLTVSGEEVIWNNSSYNYGLDFNTVSYNWPYGYSNPISTITLTLDGINPNIELTDITLTARPSQPPVGAWTTPILQVNAVDKSASWTDLHAAKHQSATPMTEQDMLRFLGDVGLDTTQQTTIDEAKQLFILLDGIARKNSQFNLTNLSVSSTGSNSTWSSGPPWFGPVYLLVAFVLWLVGLIWIAKRVGRRA